MSDLIDKWKAKYPLGSCPIHTLEAARESQRVLVHNIRMSQDMKDRIFFQEGLDKLYARWPDLRGGSDEVSVSTR